MEMVLDEPKETDMSMDVEGVTFLVDSGLTRNFNQINVGYRKNWLGEGFYVEAGSSFGGC